MYARQLKLPSEPVLAEDGRVYEREAIEHWLSIKDPCKSPITNEPMGPRLVEAVQVTDYKSLFIRFHFHRSGALLLEKARLTSSCFMRACELRVRVRACARMCIVHVRACAHVCGRACAGRRCAT